MSFRTCRHGVLDVAKPAIRTFEWAGAYSELELLRIVGELADKESALPCGETRLESRVVQAASSVLDSVNGRYAVGPLLGQGGMAAVYQVTDITTARKLALK